jgi:hypothetical protein
MREALRGTVLGREGRDPTAIGAVLRMRTDIFEDVWVAA